MGRISLAGVLVAGVLAVAFGTGYTTTKTLATDDSAWLQKGDTIVHVNGPSGRFDAVVADKPTALAASVRNNLEIVEGPDSQVFAADPTTHKVYKIDLTTMEPQTLGASGTSVLAAGSSHFVVNATSGTVSSFDPKTLALSKRLKVRGGIASEAITPSGVVYVGSEDGTVTVIDHGKTSTTRVGSGGHPIDVSVVGKEPIAIDPTTGELHNLARNATPGHAVALPGQPKATVQVAPSLSGNTAWLIQGTQLVEVNPDTGYAVQATLPTSDTFGAPLANAGNGYVPDDSANKVLVYDSTLHVTHRISVPSGLPGKADIQLVVKDGNVWADNPTSSEATVIHPNGTTQVVDKGTGNGVVVPGHGKQAQRNTPAASRRAVGSRVGTTPPQTVSPDPVTEPDPRSGSAETPPTYPQAGITSTPEPDPGAGAAQTTETPAGLEPASDTPTNPAVGSTAPTEPAGASTPTTTTPQPAASPPFTIPPAATPAVTTPAVTTPIAARSTTSRVTIPTTTPHSTSTTSTTSTTATSTTATSSTSTSTTSTTAAKVATTVVPKGLVGKSVTAACQAIAAAHLVCSEKPLGQAPAGQAPNVVTAVQKEGQTVPQQTQISVDFYGTGAPITIPAFTKGESPQAYCDQVPTGLTCTPSILGKGNPEGQVVKTDPPVGTSVPYGTSVLAEYYSSSVPIYVPTPGAPNPDGGNVPTDPQKYCAFADNLGFDCSTQLGTENDTNGVAGLADPNQPINQVASTDPAPSSTVGQTYGSHLTVTYFDKTGVAVPNEDDQGSAAACAAYTAAGLTCGTQSAVTVPAVTPGAVVPGSEKAVVDGNAVPAASLVVAAATAVNFDYAKGSTVPAIPAGTDQTTACNDITNAGLTCNPVVTTGAFGSAAGVTSVDPGAGSVEATGSPVTVNINSPNPGVTVPNCVNVAIGSCAMPAGLTLADQDNGAFTVVNCNIGLSQSPAAGQAVAPGSTLTVQYNACDTDEVVLSEWHDALDNLGGEFHYLEAGNANPSAAIWGGDGAIQGDWADDNNDVAGGYAVASNGLTCPTGTEQLWETSLAAPNADPKQQPNLSHWNVDPAVPYGSPWGGAHVVACVMPFSACPTGDLEIYIHPIANPNGGNVVDWAWSPNDTPSTGGATQPGWCELPDA